MTANLNIHNELENELILLGSNDDTELLEVIGELENYLQRAPFPVLRDIALTTGLAARGSLSCAAIIARSTIDLANKLAILKRRLAKGNKRGLPGKGVFMSTDLCPAPGRTVFLFPGEGSQYPGMLRELCLNFPVCRISFDEADTACAHAGCKQLPSQWIFPGTSQLEKIQSGEINIASSVLAVLAANTAIMRLFQQLGVSPDAVAGVGVGEITAFEAAGMYRFESADERIAAFSKGYELLNSIAKHPKTTSSVSLYCDGLTQSELKRVLEPFGDKFEIARDHGDTLLGVCVRPEVGEDVIHLLRETGATVRKLPLMEPYHTPWMTHVKPELATFFTRILQKEATVPVYSCMLAAPHEGELPNWVDNAASQWTRALRFSETIRRLHADGYRVFIELGARGSLTASIGGVLKDLPHVAVAANRGHRSAIHQLHLILATLATHGQSIDVAPLHVNRGSHPVDLARPRTTHDQRAERVFVPKMALPTLGAAELPAGLLEPAKPTFVAEDADADSQSAEHDKSGATTDFPLLLDAVEIPTEEDGCDALVVKFSTFDHPFLADSSMGGTQVSLAESTLRGLTVMPSGMLVELMAEMAHRSAPQKIVVGVAGFRISRQLVIEGSSQSVLIMAKRQLHGSIKEEHFKVSIHLHGHNGVVDERHLVAEATIVLAKDYTKAPVARTLALYSPVKLDWKGQELYHRRLHHGELFQCIESVGQWGENGLTAGWRVLPRSRLLRHSATPRFSLDPHLLHAVASALALWDAREPANGRIQAPVGFERLDIFAAPPAEPSRGRLNIFTSQPKNGTACADAEIISEKGLLLASVRKWENRVYHLSPALHGLMLNPVEGFLTSKLPDELLPNLSQEVVCCVADNMPPEVAALDESLWLKIVAYLTLSVSERWRWREMGGTTQRRREWLLGRIAAKDSVRHCLRTRYGRKWAAADIRIDTDESGKPRPQGIWRQHCGARMDISITHTSHSIAAAAAPNAILGIDVEHSTRTLSDDFTAAAFDITEQEIAAESGESGTALFRFWCAKEALVKAIGTGLRYGASDLMVRTFDRTTGLVNIEATRLWTQAFPLLRKQPLPVHTCLIDELVLAVCLMDPAFADEIRNTSYEPE